MTHSLHSRTITLLAWTAAIATVLWQRLLQPALLMLIHELQQPREQPQTRTIRAGKLTVLRPVTRASLEKRTCKELRAMAGIRRHLAKRQLIDLILAS